MTDEQQGFPFDQPRPRRDFGDTGDVCSNYHGGADTSAEAERGKDPVARKGHELNIVATIRASGGYGKTCDELEVILGLPHQSVSARITDLQSAGAIVDSGQRRPTRSGRAARVYVLVGG